MTEPFACYLSQRVSLSLFSLSASFLFPGRHSPTLFWLKYRRRATADCAQVRRAPLWLMVRSTLACVRVTLLRA
eukprot:10739158-Alexandrium_andersonii.AAC.1